MQDARSAGTSWTNGSKGIHSEVSGPMIAHCGQWHAVATTLPMVMPCCGAVVLVATTRVARGKLLRSWIRERWWILLVLLQAVLGSVFRN